MQGAEVQTLLEDLFSYTPRPDPEFSEQEVQVRGAGWCGPLGPLGPLGVQGAWCELVLGSLATPPIRSLQRAVGSAAAAACQHVIPGQPISGCRPRATPPPPPQVLAALLQAGCPVSPPPRFKGFKRAPETPLSLSTYRSYGPRVGRRAGAACRPASPAAAALPLRHTYCSSLAHQSPVISRHSSVLAWGYWLGRG